MAALVSLKARRCLAQRSINAYEYLLRRSLLPARRMLRSLSPPRCVRGQ